LPRFIARAAKCAFKEASEPVTIAPPVHMIKLTETREITHYMDDDDRR